LEGVKRDYLKKCIQAKEEIYKLKQENSQLKGEIDKLKRGERAIDESVVGIND
jgi:cell division protein FtsB